ncbi:hypothetical protein EXIGLDRAFT_838197 [Exidia glandulosa HHB12029]|uniref:Transmembrane protein n=1 Tax=Exidia glandulosa HHB12029 TaxID=1314781 RepID=A0A165G260_EXIGL|nr:hypothetical protein EXIGLDRAFT_838197 [Exidia glandulosa HHB12029]
MLAQAASFMVASTPTLLLLHRVGVKKLAANYKPIYTRSIWDWPPPHPSEGTVLTQTTFTADAVRRLSGAESTYAVLTALLLVCVVLVYCLWLSAEPPHPHRGVEVHTNTLSSVEEVANLDSTDEQHVEAVTPAPCQDVHRAVDAISGPSRPPPVAPLYVENPVHPPPVPETPFSSLTQEHDIVHDVAPGRDAVGGSLPSTSAPIAHLHVEEASTPTPREAPVSASFVKDRPVVRNEVVNRDKQKPVPFRSTHISRLYARAPRLSPIPEAYTLGEQGLATEVARDRDTIQPLQYDADSVTDNAAFAAAAVHPSTPPACTKTESDVASSSISQCQGQDKRTVHVLEGPSAMKDTVTALLADVDAVCSALNPRFNSPSTSNATSEFMIQAEASRLVPLVRPAVSGYSDGANGGVMSHRILARMEHVHKKNLPSVN